MSNKQNDIVEEYKKEMIDEAVDKTVKEYGDTLKMLGNEEIQINDHILKIQGTASLPEALKFQHNYKITVEGEVRGADPRPNDDGTQNIIYPVRLITAEILKDDGAIIKSKDKRSMSKKLKGSIYFWQTEHKPEEDEEEFYKGYIGWLISETERLIPYYLKEKDKLN